MENNTDIKILVVEDEEVAVKLISLFLTKTDCKFNIATTGAQAIKLLLYNHYDLILMDIGLPDISGFSLSKIIKTWKTDGLHPYIVALTAHGSINQEKSSIEAGMDEFLKKPLDFKTFEDLLNKIKAKKLSNLR